MIDVNDNLTILQKNCPKIHVAISPWDLTDDYNRHAGVTLVSLLEHCSQPITIHILYDKKLCIGKEKETDYNKTCYQKIADKYNCKLLYHHVELPEWINQLVNIQAFTPGTLLRLNIPEILQDIDKIIYLDCDTIVLTDIVNLWNVNLDGKYLGGVLGSQWSHGSQSKRDIPMNKSMYNYYLKRKINISEYFNAGVLVLNLSELRKISFTEKAYEYLKNNLDAPCLDQDALNYVCQNNFVKLDWKYNSNRRYFNELNNDCIIHLIGRIQKPWKKYSDSLDDIYWEYLRDTPWCENIHDFYAYLRDVPDINKALSKIEHNLFANLSGTKKEKIHYLIHFLIHMVKNVIKSALHSFR